ncbi:hypothetical protein, partial [Streptomyces mirabilis]|uniref:hypothetical protein n=1 Tax=Streptomyces mirabilis TaxID=68239 RepID=UPI0037157B67
NDQHDAIHWIRRSRSDQLRDMTSELGLTTKILTLAEYLIHAGASGFRVCWPLSLQSALSRGWRCARHGDRSCC